MRHLTAQSFALCVIVSIHALPWSFNKSAGQFRNIQSIPDRPVGVDPNSFHGSQFAFFDEIGFVAGSPAVEAAPVFLYSRTSTLDDPCYPESAVILGSDPSQPNSGTDGPRGPASMNPGEDCTDPGPYTGAYSRGNPFPVYVGTAWCGDDAVWKLNYDIYYVHEGNMLAGHDHDWEGITIVFSRDPGAKGEDWWRRAGAHYNRYNNHDWYKYSDLVSVVVEGPGDNYVASEIPGGNLKHPKVYVGFFSHSAYARKDDSILVNAGPASTEYRSDDWWRLPRAEDLHSWKEIDPNWNYGRAESTPPYNQGAMCGWGIGELS